MRNTICRNFKNAFAECTVFNPSTGSIMTENVFLPVFMEDVKAVEKYMHKHNLCKYKLVMVNSIKVEEQLYGMEEDTFMRYATPCAERGKDTYGKITKNCKALSATMYVFNTVEQTVSTREATFPVVPEKKYSEQGNKLLNENERFIMFENVHEITTLYAISEADFIAHARKMVNHQKYMD